MRRVSYLLLLWLPLLASARPPQLEHLDRAPLVQLSAIQVRSQLRAVKHEPLRFAVRAAVMATTASGAWDEPEPGIARWRLRVASAGAHSLSFELRGLQLPPDAELWIYDREGHDLQGPIVTPAPDPLFTPIVRAEEVFIEATMRSADREAFAVTVAEAFHAYADITRRSFTYNAASDTGNGASGTCNTDVACSLADSWQPQVRASVLLTIAGTTLCSGTLVNNALQDDRPLLLTANHCGITDLNVSSTIAYFNVQRSACASGATGSVSQNIRGKTLLASSRAGSDTDYALFELSSKPPASFNAYYSGFDVSSSVPTSGVGIHHPSGDDKKISAYSSPAAARSNVCIGSSCGLLSASGFEINAWAVVWSRGTTEGGSSGSGLWNQNGYLVGTLSGGTAECTSASSNNGGSDYYARIDTAWNAAGSGLIPVSLKDVLDPDDSGCTRFSGKAPGITSALNCNGSPTSGGGTGTTTTPPPIPENLSGGGGGGGSTGLDLLGLLLLVLLRSGRPAWPARLMASARHASGLKKP